MSKKGELTENIYIMYGLEYTGIQLSLTANFKQIATPIQGA